MKFTTLLSTVAALTATVVTAAPAPAPAPELHKRALEVIYLSNCQTVGGGTSRWDLEYEYYENTNNSQNGEFPGPGETNRAVVPYTSTSTTPASWYNDRSATFSTGVKVNSEIWALDGAIGSQAGTAYNGYHVFGCYKDSGRKLYGTESKTGNTVNWYRNCYAQFYCMH